MKNTATKKYGAMMCCVLVVACGSSKDEAQVMSNEVTSPADQLTAEVSQTPKTTPLPDWFPENIRLPADFRISEARTYGQNTLFLAGESVETSDDLLDAFQSSLAEAGYQVMDHEDLDTQYLVMFSGPGWDQNGVRIKDQGDSRRIEISLTRLSD